LTIITTTRKLFSVVLSNFEFNHHFTGAQWIGAAIVMACTALELIFGKKPQTNEKSPKKE
jgi:drug/metabolite transporter (DMT)-like permease